MSKLDQRRSTSSAEGCAVFICIANKKIPLTKRGFLGRHADPEVIRCVAHCYPEANLAVATGEASGVVVLDIDCKKGKNGEADLAALEREHGALPSTVESITPSGGRHLWFKHPGHPVPSSQGSLAPGIDIRGDGGYVLGPAELRHRAGQERSRGVRRQLLLVRRQCLDVRTDAAVDALSEPPARRPRAGRIFRRARQRRAGWMPERLAHVHGREAVSSRARPCQVYDITLHLNELNVPPLPAERVARWSKISQKKKYLRESFSDESDAPPLDEDLRARLERKS